MEGMTTHINLGKQNKYAIALARESNKIPIEKKSFTVLCPLLSKNCCANNKPDKRESQIIFFQMWSENEGEYTQALYIKPPTMASKKSPTKIIKIPFEVFLLGIISFVKKLDIFISPFILTSH